MVLFGRPDAVLAERVPLVRRFMPFIMRRRNESLVWFEQDVAVDAALAFADAFTRTHDVRLTFFHMVLRSIARVLDEFPRLNRSSTPTTSASRTASTARALSQMKDLLERPDQLV